MLEITEEPMALLRGLPNTSEDVNAVSVDSRTKAIEMLRLDMPVTAAGDCGAINVWLDDDLEWRCEFMRWRGTVCSLTTTKKGVVYEWLREWFPQIHSM